MSERSNIEAIYIFRLVEDTDRLHVVFFNIEKAFFSKNQHRPKNSTGLQIIILIDA